MTINFNSVSVAVGLPPQNLESRDVRPELSLSLALTAETCQPRFKARPGPALHCRLDTHLDRGRGALLTPIPGPSDVPTALGPVLLRPFWRLHFISIQDFIHQRLERHSSQPDRRTGFRGKAGGQHACMVRGYGRLLQNSVSLPSPDSKEGRKRPQVKREGERKSQVSALPKKC